MIQFTTGMTMLVSSMYILGSSPISPVTIEKPVSVASSSPTAYSTTTDKQILSPKEVEKYIRNRYASDPVLVDIARCESSLRQFDAKGNVIRGFVNNADVGVMQINEKYHADKAIELGLNIYTMEGNIDFAKYLYEKYGASPWQSSSKCWSHSDLLAQR
jgi:hypothetical protein